ncbi:MAG: hypothetical protein EOS41_26595 [Mesorhizobium sp.]|uniref:hypothetical protein n=1 Tax=Mesorhizobium sp. TaxID=1871066 RepID=UPI000FEA2843|nr:hypothetical protein [Mesorhizobium sp.]RWE21472.1 MAG: hypothetical protein EOS41_26595 [Mesorhizobium sp.]
MSSLLLLPVLAAVTPADQKIAIICFDSTALSEAHLQAAWPKGDHERILKVRIEQTEAWRLINRADGIYNWDLIGATLSQVCRYSLLGENSARLLSNAVRSRLCASNSKTATTSDL